MKRSIMVYVGILGLSQFLASAALAAGDGSLCYSTGPIDNEDGPERVVFAEEVVVKVLNNSPSNNVTARILVSGLDGVKINIFDDSFSLPPQSSGVRIADIVQRPDNGTIFQYEIQVKLTGAASSALLGAFARNPNDNEQVASQRLVHSEWTEIPCSEFGPIP